MLGRAIASHRGQVGGSDRERIVEAGFDGYLQKPISVRDFPVQVLRHLTAGRQAAVPS